MKRLILAAVAAFIAMPAMAQLAPSALTAYSLRLDIGTKTATAVAGAATLAKSSGVITTEALTTAGGSSYTLTLTDSTIAVNDIVLANVGYGSATAGEPHVARVQPSAGLVTIVVRNAASAAAVNGTLKISFAVLKN